MPTRYNVKYLLEKIQGSVKEIDLSLSFNLNRYLSGGAFKSVVIRRSKPNRSTRAVYMNHPLACKGNLIWDNSVLLKRQTRCTNRQLTGELPD